ncbi:MAG: FAD-binding oxidoreductase, partial [Candidatus Dadabacteria bacterium]
MTNRAPWRHDPDALATVSEDASGLIGSPDGVARPRTPDDLDRIVAEAIRARVPFTPGGGFTSTTGAPLA